MVSSPLEEIAEAPGLSGSDQMSALQEILLERFPDGGTACNMQHSMQRLMQHAAAVQHAPCNMQRTQCNVHSRPNARAHRKHSLRGGRAYAQARKPQ